MMLKGVIWEIFFSNFTLKFLEWLVICENTVTLPGFSYLISGLKNSALKTS